eukprot:TCALIF_04169-PA protein Name:"Similar to Gad1 Glutamate decarboxylase (Drosophila melanogaster)" AED:0.79 eAED:0.79 QI:0/0.33/0.25/0.5/1/1/4/0/290
MVARETVTSNRSWIMFPALKRSHTRSATRPWRTFPLDLQSRGWMWRGIAAEQKNSRMKNQGTSCSRMPSHKVPLLSPGQTPWPSPRGLLPPNLREAVQAELGPGVLGELETNIMANVGDLFYDDLYPVNQDAETADPNTRAFLLEVVKILLDFISKTNDRNEKVLEFHHPIEMKKKLDLALKEDPEPVSQLLEDCKQALENQVKTAHPILRSPMFSSTTTLPDETGSNGMASCCPNFRIPSIPLLLVLLFLLLLLLFLLSRPRRELMHENVGSRNKKKRRSMRYGSRNEY